MGGCFWIYVAEPVRGSGTHSHTEPQSHRKPRRDRQGGFSFSVRNMSLPSCLYQIILLFDYYAAAATCESSCTRHCYNLLQVFEDLYCHVYNHNVEGTAQSQAPSNNFHAILIK